MKKNVSILGPGCLNVRLSLKISANACDGVCPLKSRSFRRSEIARMNVKRSAVMVEENCNGKAAFRKRRTSPPGFTDESLVLMCVTG